MSASTDQLTRMLAEYRTGLDAELALLEQLERQSEELRTASDRNAMPLIARITEDRERVMASLVAVEHGLRPLRDQLAANLDRVRALEGFPTVAERHLRAGRLVQRIMAADGTTLDALKRAEEARRAAAQVLETGEATLAAYRRIVAPPPGNAGLVDRRG